MNGDNSVWCEVDDCCMRELLPVSNLEWCRDQLQRISAHADAHRVEIEPGVYVYSAMYEREGAPTPISSLRILRTELHDLLSGEGFARRPVVGDVWGTGTEAFDDVAAHCAPSTRVPDIDDIVFFDWGEDDVVASIWLDGPMFEGDVGLQSLLMTIGRRYPLLYVDWAWNLLAPLQDPAALTAILPPDPKPAD